MYGAVQGGLPEIYNNRNQGSAGYDEREREVPSRRTVTLSALFWHTGARIKLPFLASCPASAANLKAGRGKVLMSHSVSVTSPPQNRSRTLISVYVPGKAGESSTSTLG